MSQAQARPSWARLPSGGNDMLETHFSGRSGRPGTAAILMALFCLMAVSLGSNGPAFAHASLVRVEPADGSMVATAPKSFFLTFSEPTSPLVLKLVRPDGTAVILDRFALKDTTLDIEAPADLADGTYVLSWRIVSEDGHPVGGSAVFSIGAPSAGPAMGGIDETIDYCVRAAIWISKICLYSALFFGAGGIFFIHWVGGRSRPARCVAWTAAAIGLIATPLSAGLQGLDALAIPVSGLLAPAVWKAGFSTSYGMTAVIACVALLAALAAGLLHGPAGKALSLAGYVGIGVALAASGHASAAHPQWLMRPAVFLHGIGIAFWAGSLLPMAIAFKSLSEEAIPLLRRFSRIIPFAIVPLVAAGLLLAVVQVRTVGAITTTAYGQVLLAKLLVLIVLFTLAAINRLRLTTPTEDGDERAARWLRHSIRCEIVLMLVIFAIAGLWRFTPPPRALEEAAAVPASVHIHTEKAMAEVTMTPGHAGPMAATIVVMTGDFGPLDAKEIALVLSNPSAGIEQIKRQARKSDDGIWRVDDLTLPVPGQWTVRVDILVSDFERLRIEDRIDIRR